MNFRYWIYGAACLFALFVADATVAQDKPLKVFVLCGQSNMQGHARVGTLDVLKYDSKTAPILSDIVNGDGEPKTFENIWISSIGSSPEEKTGKLTVGYGAEADPPKIGPELTFGIYMQKHLDEPILIIKTSWGGKSLNTDFRPPSAGPYEFNEKQLENFAKQEKNLEEIKAQKAEATGVYYRLTIEHVRSVLSDIKRVYPDYDPQQGYELAGFVWFQGWNDMVDGGTYSERGSEGGYDQYSDLLADFIRDVRKDLSAPELPFVVGVMGVGGPTAKYDDSQKRYVNIHQSFRDAMAAPALQDEFKGSVANVLTENYWDLEVTALRREDAKLQQQVKKRKESEGLSRQQEQAALEELRKETFSERELELMTQGVSNAEFHYLGSAKIVTQIGKAMADTMHKLMEE